MTEQVKVLFQENLGDDGEDEYQIETMWATTSGEGFRLDNIPFYAKGVSYADIVSAEWENDFLHFRKVLKRSGNKTIHILFSEQKDVKYTLKKLKEMGCISEISNIPELIAVNVPLESSYDNILDYLEDGVAKDRWGWQEACSGFEEDGETYSNHSFGTSSPSE